MTLKDSMYVPSLKTLQAMSTEELNERQLMWREAVGNIQAQLLRAKDSEEEDETWQRSARVALVTLQKGLGLIKEILKVRTAAAHGRNTHALYVAAKELLCLVDDESPEADAAWDRLEEVIRAIDAGELAPQEGITV